VPLKILESIRFMTPKRRIGIIGGLGMLAGMDVHAKLLHASRHHPADGSPDVLFEQKRFDSGKPTGAGHPDLNARKLYIFDMMKRFELAQADSVMLPCFISHTFLHELQTELPLPIPNMMDALLAYLKRHAGGVDLGVLTSDYVRQQKLFETYFEPHGYRVVYPNAALQARCVMPAVYDAAGLQAGGSHERAAALLLEACVDLIDQGADIIVPGATEIAIITEMLGAGCDVPVIDTNLVYAEYALAHRDPPPAHDFTIGIVGGIGPAATVDFMDKIVRNTPAQSDQGHLKMLVDHNPKIPDRTANLIGCGEDPTIAIFAACKRLEANHVDLIAIPCNTAHAYVDRILPYLKVPVVNMLHETVRHIAQYYPGRGTVGLLATSGTIASRVYHDAARDAPFQLIVPDEAHQGLVMHAIYGETGVKAGYTEGRCKDDLMRALAHLVRRGARLVILGCTELPLLVNSGADVEVDGQRIAILDPTDLLARRCVSLADACDKPM
jgi:aspartate racemase